MNRTRKITFRVTENEGKLIDSKAAKAHMTNSNYVRSVALGKNIVVVEGLPEFNTQLKRIGNNVNQLTVLFRERRIENINLQGIKEELQTITKDVSQLLRGGEAA